MIRQPFILRYQPPDYFDAVNFNTEYKKIIRHNDVCFLYRTNTIPTDIVRKQIGNTYDLVDINEYEIYHKYYCKIKCKEPIISQKTYQLWKEMQLNMNHYQYVLSCYYPEFIIYQSIWKPNVLHPYSSKAIMISPNVLPRVYSADAIYNPIQIDMEALVDMILYTPYCFHKKINCIQNQSKSYYVRKDNKLLPFHEAIIEGYTRPNMYFNKEHNIGWRQVFCKNRNRFITFCINQYTYDKFIDDMKEAINNLHQNNIVYLDWNMRNIGYSEIDKCFKLFDFNCVRYVYNKQIVDYPDCKRYIKDYRNKLKYETHNRRQPRNAFEIDFLLFYTMLQELTVL